MQNLPIITKSTELPTLESHPESPKVKSCCGECQNNGICKSYIDENPLTSKHHHHHPLKRETDILQPLTVDLSESM